jgi:hypoxanthine phosphoribosyltransferase
LSQFLIFAALIAVAMAAYDPAAKTEEIVEVVEPVTIN